MGASRLQASAAAVGGVSEKEVRAREVIGNKQTNPLGMQSLTKILNFLLQPLCPSLKAMTSHCGKHQRKPGHQEHDLRRLQTLRDMISLRTEHQ